MCSTMEYVMNSLYSIDASQDQLSSCLAAVKLFLTLHMSNSRFEEEVDQH